VTLTVHVFARLRDLAGSETIVIPLPTPATARDVRDVIRRNHPSLAELLVRSQIAINGEFVNDDAAVRPGDEAAVIPPVSGG